MRYTRASNKDRQIMLRRSYTTFSSFSLLLSFACFHWLSIFLTLCITLAISLSLRNSHFDHPARHPEPFRIACLSFMTSQSSRLFLFLLLPRRDCYTFTMLALKHRQRPRLQLSYLTLKLIRSFIEFALKFFIILWIEFTNFQIYLICMKMFTDDLSASNSLNVKVSIS